MVGANVSKSTARVHHWPDPGFCGRRAARPAECLDRAQNLPSQDFQFFQKLWRRRSGAGLKRRQPDSHFRNLLLDLVHEASRLFYRVSMNDGQLLLVNAVGAEARF